MERLARIAFVFAACFAFVMAVIPYPPPIPGEPSDKLMHMVAFATLGVLGGYGFRVSVTRLLLWLTLFGAAIEIVQAIPALHRDSDIRDLLADVLASFIALHVARYIVNWSNKSK